MTIGSGAGIKRLPCRIFRPDHWLGAPHIAQQLKPHGIPPEEVYSILISLAQDGILASRTRVVAGRPTAMYRLFDDSGAARDRALAAVHEVRSREIELAKILGALLEQPKIWRPGIDIINRARLRSTIVYPYLAALQRSGWVEKHPRGDGYNFRLVEDKLGAVSEFVRMIHRLPQL